MIGVLHNTGLVYVFTGEGKGKTSAALGVATRALLIGKRVIWVAFYKGRDWELAEKKLSEKFSNLEMYFTGRGFRISTPVDQRVSKSVDQLAGKPVKIAKIAGERVVVDTASEEEHREAAEEGLQQAENSLQQKPFLLAMDEVLNAVSEGLVESKRVMELLSKRGTTHIVLTGRVNERARRLLREADLVTECKKVKHPYDTGKLAVRGLDY